MMILTDQEWQEIEELALTKSVREELAQLAILRKATFRGADTDVTMVFNFMDKFQEFVKDVRPPKRPFIENNMKL
jgi:hypothetical protein